MDNFAKKFGLPPRGYTYEDITVDKDKWSNRIRFFFDSEGKIQHAEIISEPYQTEEEKKIRELKKKLQTHIENQEFEEAAKIRDELNSLE